MTDNKMCTVGVTFYGRDLFWEIHDGLADPTQSRLN